ncbi:integrase catalytic domain-containing protein [Trichonephila clavipes]|nr:integrase catalytic domain-containing protein [Trichonephila clavipes]
MNSDNARTLKSADCELKRLYMNICEPDVQNYFGEKGIKWQYIVARAAWWGGYWERMVQTTKIALRKILGRALISFEELQTIWAEVEAIINSRPLTSVYNEPNEPFPFTPSNFLTGRRVTALSNWSGKRNIELFKGKKELTIRYLYRERLLNIFWKRWKKEYLLQVKRRFLGNCGDLERSLRSTRDETIKIKTLSNKLQIDNCVIVIKSYKVPCGEHAGTYNVPAINEVAVVMTGDPTERRDIRTQRRDNTLKTIQDNHRSYDAQHYSLIFWEREDRYNLNIKQRNPTTGEELIKKVPGPTSFQYLRKVNETLYDTSFDACRDLHLLEDDTLWDLTLANASLNSTPQQIRQFF